MAGEGGDAADDNDDDNDDASVWRGGSSCTRNRCARCNNDGLIAWLARF